MATVEFNKFTQLATLSLPEPDSTERRLIQVRCSGTWSRSEIHTFLMGMAADYAEKPEVGE